jgi:two-component sensor histidine kinase
LPAVAAAVDASPASDAAGLALPTLPPMTSSPPIKEQLLTAWRQNWRLRKRREAPLWARLSVPLVFGLVIGLALSLIGVFSRGRAGELDAWTSALRENLTIAWVVSFMIFFGYRSLELLLSEAQLQRLNRDRGWRSVLLHAGMSIVLVCIGGVVGLSLLGWVNDVDTWARIGQRPRTVLEFLVISVVITALTSLWWWWYQRRQLAALRASEAQLRLLQAQIEPHFLFNTLANVHGLMDADPARAKQMLEAFTDYLRASLSQLRSADATLDSELAMARSYLELMQTRMMDRLQFEIEADEAARRALLPPLLLQPLIENAIHHGLEPKLEGGRILVQARLQAGQLSIRIADDGLGLPALDAPGAPARRPRRAGTGLALANIRARLQTRYGADARLELGHNPAAGGGTVATLSLPFSTETSFAS